MSSDLNVMGIYRIDGPGGKLYIGSALNIHQRWKSHRLQLNKGKHHSPHFSNAWRKHGEGAFTISLIEVVSDKADLLRIEQIWLDILFQSYPPTHIYNSCPKAGSRMGSPVSEETRQKLSRAGKGKRFPNREKWTEERKARARGRTLTEEQKRRLRAAQSSSEKFKAAMRNPERTRKARETFERKSPEEKARIRQRIVDANRGKVLTPEHRQRLSEAHKGVSFTEERRLKLIGRKNAPCSEQRKQRISVANTGKVRTTEGLRNLSRAHRKGHVYTMIAPDGTIYEDIDSIMGFAREHGLTEGTVRGALRGNQTRAGWRGLITQEEPDG